MGERSVQKNRSLGKKHGRILILACIFMLFLAVWQWKAIDVFAAAVEECGDFVVTGGTKDIDYSFVDGALQIHTDTPITIQNVDPSVSTKDCIVIEQDVDADITLAGVNIETERYAAMRIATNSSGNVTIRLADGTDNYLKSGMNYAGLEKDGNHTKGTLTITGNTGTLTAQGGMNAAGIGGGAMRDSANIIINGGTVTARGGQFGAGIGGGENGSGQYITINGGTVTAKGSSMAAGIGGGASAKGSNIAIEGGTVTATGGGGGAGIGGGNKSAGDNIFINNSDVTATGAGGAAGIGGGRAGSGTDIIVWGYIIRITPADPADDIGGGKGSEDTNSTLIMIGREGTVNGYVTLKRDITLDADVTLTIEEDSVLKIEEGVTLENNGTIYNMGAIQNEGVITSGGLIKGKGVLRGSGSAPALIDADDIKEEPQTGEESCFQLYIFLAVMAAAGICIIKSGEKKTGVF